MPETYSNSHLESGYWRRSLCMPHGNKVKKWHGKHPSSGQRGLKNMNQRGAFSICGDRSRTNLLFSSSQQCDSHPHDPQRCESHPHVIRKMARASPTLVNKYLFPFRELSCVFMCFALAQGNTITTPKDIYGCHSSCGASPQSISRS